MTAYIWPQPPLLASQIDVSSLRLNGVPALTSPAPRIHERRSHPQGDGSAARKCSRASRTAVSATWI